MVKPIETLEQKAARAAYIKEWHRKNPDARKRYNAAARAKDPHIHRKYYRTKVAKDPEKYSAYSKLWRTANAEHIRNKQRKDRELRPAWVMLTKFRTKAKTRGIAFNLELADIVVPTHCPVLGIKLAIGTGSMTDASPSLDRIVPALGYTKGNVMVISVRANRIKNDATTGELVKIAAFYAALTNYSPEKA